MRFLNPGSFAVALLCFLLPFTNLQCNKNKLATFTGVELVKGVSIEEKVSLGMMGGMMGMGSGMPAGVTSQKVRELPLIACAIILLLAGVAVTIMTFTKASPKKIKEWAIVGHVLALFMLVIEIVKMEISLNGANSKMNERASFMASSMKFDWGMEIGLILLLVITIGFIIYNAATFKKAGVVTLPPPLDSEPGQGAGQVEP